MSSSPHQDRARAGSHIAAAVNGATSLRTRANASALATLKLVREPRFVASWPATVRRIEKRRGSGSTSDNQEREAMRTQHFLSMLAIGENPMEKWTADALASGSAPARRRPGLGNGSDRGFCNLPDATSSDQFKARPSFWQMSSARQCVICVTRLVKRGRSHLPFMFASLPCRTRTGLGLPHSLELTQLRQRTVPLGREIGGSHT